MVATDALALTIPDSTVSPSQFRLEAELLWQGDMAGEFIRDFKSETGAPGLVDVTLGDNFAKAATNGGEGKEIIAITTAQISGTVTDLPGVSYIGSAIAKSRIDYNWRVEPKDAAACQLVPECAGITSVPLILTFEAWTVALGTANVHASVWAFIGSLAFDRSDKALGVANSTFFEGGYMVDFALPPPDGPGFLDAIVPLGVEHDIWISTEIQLDHGTQDYFGKATAFIDPVIEVDPAFEHRDFFDILVSPNIILNDPAISAFPPPMPPQVPVPAAIWLFGSGLIGMIAIARRKKS